MQNKLTFNPEIHEYLLNGSRIPSVTQALQVLNPLSGIPLDRLESAREFGIAVHLACELYDLNNLDEVNLDPNLQPYLEGWMLFKDDMNFKPLRVEERVYSVKYRFAGTVDRIGEDLSILDIKSGSELTEIVGLQTAGYQLAYNEMNPKNKSKKRLGVLLTPAGTYKIQEYKNKNDANVFLSALSITNWKERNK
jgi:hypothetical protein